MEEIHGVGEKHWGQFGRRPGASAHARRVQSTPVELLQPPQGQQLARQRRPVCVLAGWALGFDHRGRICPGRRGGGGAVVGLHPDLDPGTATNRGAKRRRRGAGMDADRRMAETKSERVWVTAKARSVTTTNQGGGDVNYSVIYREPVWAEPEKKPTRRIRRVINTLISCVRVYLKGRGSSSSRERQYLIFSFQPCSSLNMYQILHDVIDDHSNSFLKNQPTHFLSNQTNSRLRFQVSNPRDGEKNRNDTIR